MATSFEHTFFYVCLTHLTLKARKNWFFPLGSKNEKKKSSNDKVFFLIFLYSTVFENKKFIHLSFCRLARDMRPKSGYNKRDSLQKLLLYFKINKKLFSPLHTQIQLSEEVKNILLATQVLKIKINFHTLNFFLSFPHHAVNFDIVKVIIWYFHCVYGDFS